MQIFDFHFNPPEKSKLARGEVKENLIFDSFCYEPENIYEKRVGSLYMMGILKNVLPQNVKFLDNLAKTIKEKYYRLISVSPEKSFKESLQRANESLEKIAKEGNVSWLGNLSFVVIALKDFELNLTKVGDLKVFLFRQGQIIDMDKRVKFDEIEPYPLKLFSNIVSGKLSEDDIILLLTKEVLDVFLKENLLNEIAKISSSVSPVNKPKGLKEILNNKKEELTKISGALLSMILSKEALAPKREILTQPKALKIFSFKEVFRPLIGTFKFPRISFKKPVFKVPRLKFKIAKPELSPVKIPQLKLKLPKFLLAEFWKAKLQILYSNKKITLILALILFLSFGFFIFEKKEEQQLKEYQTQLNQIQEKINQAENYLIIAKNNPQAEKKANELFMETWEGISPLVTLASTFPSDFANQVLTSKNTISENLYQLNKLKIIEEPELFFEFQAREFIPQKITSDSRNLYFFSPYSENVFQINQEGESKILVIDKKFNSAVSLVNTISFFLKPNQLINLKDGQFSETFPLGFPYSDFDFNEMSSYLSNLYFLDIKQGKIVKYPYLGNFQWGSPQLWLSSEIKKANDFRSMTIDGSAWILTKNNSIERYYGGNLQETLELKIFPYPEYISKIFTSPTLPYLYLLESTQKRIIIINKSGGIINQFQSEKFDNLLDFRVSENGKTIYLLNGLKVYQITF
jgi:hypothetical protein